MGLFSSSTPSPAPSPITLERITAIYDANEWHYQVDEDGDIGAKWENITIFVILRGDSREILHIQGQYAKRLPLEMTEQVRDLVDTWNRDHLWPMCYWFRNDGEDFLRIACSYSIDEESGVTDAQLVRHLKNGIGTMLSFTSACNVEFSAVE